MQLMLRKVVIVTLYDSKRPASGSQLIAWVPYSIDVSVLIPQVSSSLGKDNPMHALREPTTCRLRTGSTT